MALIRRGEKTGLLVRVRVVGAGGRAAVGERPNVRVVAAYRRRRGGAGWPAAIKGRFEGIDG